MSQLCSYVWHNESCNLSLCTVNWGMTIKEHQVSWSENQGTPVWTCSHKWAFGSEHYRTLQFPCLTLTHISIVQCVFFFPSFLSMKTQKVIESQWEQHVLGFTTAIAASVRQCHRFLDGIWEDLPWLLPAWVDWGAFNMLGPTSGLEDSDLSTYCSAES